MNKIGIDLGGTKIEGVILDRNNTVLERKRISTHQQKGYEYVVENTVALYQLLRSKIKNKKHSLGIGTPGYMNGTGEIKNSSMLCLNNRLFAADFEKLSGTLPHIENDANCFAIAEALSGAGKGKSLVFGVIMGTGCGGGIVYNNSLIRGFQFLGGEVGHTTLYPDGVECFCGKKGCVERYISGTGVEERYKRLTNTGKDLKSILDDYRNGEEQAKTIMEEFFENFGLSMSNIINMMDPDTIVLGGGVSNVDEIYTIGIERVKKYVFKENPQINIVKNTLGDSAGVIGAALLQELV